MSEKEAWIEVQRRWNEEATEVGCLCHQYATSPELCGRHARDYQAVCLRDGVMPCQAQLYVSSLPHHTVSASISVPHAI